MSMPLFSRYLLAAAAAGTGGALLLSPKMSVFGAGQKDEGVALADHVPSRAQQLAAMRASTREKPFDILVIGGGGTGAGCAADAQTRGLKTVLIERDDFGSGTSSRSTKLVHGGVRYLEKAVFQLDYSQLKLVYEALHERQAFLKNAAHLSHPLAILMPCYNWWDVPYFWAGLKAYDFVAGSGNLVQSKYMNTTESLSQLPTLATTNPINGKSLKGSILYYDGQFDDSRMAVTLACTAAAAGAVVANHVECKELIKNNEGVVVGARCHDLISDETVDVYAKAVINATGSLADTVRKQSDPKIKNCVAGSSGTHITLPSFYGSTSMGLIIPKTRDGRVLFMLPWQGSLIAGTTDAPCDVNPNRSAVEDEVTFIIDSLSDILGVKVQRSDVLSAWSGVRPLPSNPNAKDTQNVVRDHLIFTDPDGMVSVTGGKWTTYRRMAEEAVDAAIQTGRLPMNISKCRTHNMRLIGSQDYRPTLHAEIAQQFSKFNKQQTAATPAAGAGQPAAPGVPAPAPATPAVALDVDSSTAFHLARSYGDRAPAVLSTAVEKNLGARLHPRHPILEAEVAYCVQNEYCETADDFLQRRTRLAFVDAAAAVEAVPRVVEIMGAQLNWSKDRKLQEQERARATLQKAFFAAP